MSKAEDTDVPQAVYSTDSIDDLRDLLGKAETWAADELAREGIGAEFRDAREFVEDELLEDADA